MKEPLISLITQHKLSERITMKGTNISLAGGKSPAISPSIYRSPSIVQLIKLQALSWDLQFSPGKQQELKNDLPLNKTNTLKEIP